LSFLFGQLLLTAAKQPMALVFENAGGMAVNSRMERMLEVKPEHIHDRSGIYMGSYEEVQKVIAAHQ
jgi:fructose-1,6-bisphosphatase I